MRRLEGRVALVTGAGRGIGQAIAIRLASEGARVAATDLDELTAQATAAEIGPGAIGLKMDVTDSVAVRAAMEEAERVMGPLDILVSNAGWDKVEALRKSREGTGEKIWAINVKGELNCA